MAVVEVPQTLEYRGGQLNAAPVLEDNGTADEEKELYPLFSDSNVSSVQLASLFGKLKYEENLIDSIYETEKSKSHVSATPLSTAFLTTSIVQDFQDSHDDEEDTRSSHEYLNDLEEEYQAGALLAKAVLQKGYSKSPFQPKLLHLSEHKPEPRRTKDFKAKYNKVKAKLALLSSSASVPSSSSSKNKEAWLNSSNKVNQCISEQIPTQKMKILGIDQLTEDTSSSGPKNPVFVKSLVDNPEVSITGSNKPKLSKTEDSTLSNHDSGKLMNLQSVAPPSLLEKLTGAKPISGLKTIKSILKLKSTFKAETLKGIINNEPSSAPARGNKSSSVSKTDSALAGKLKNVKIEDDSTLAIVMKELNELKLQISKNKSYYFRNKNSQQVPSNALQNKYKTQFKMNYELCG
ncbi:hypothetical protein Tco_0722172 [Tanacetum coccineum]